MKRRQKLGDKNYKLKIDTAFKNECNITTHNKYISICE